MSEDQNAFSSLSELFENAFTLFNNINKTEEPTNNRKVQSDIREAMKLFEDLTRFVSLVDMFSDNETIDEIATEHLKYLLLPALLGTLATKMTSVDYANDRMHIVNVAEIYFLDFIKRLKTYGIMDVTIPENISEQEESSVSDTRNKSNTELMREMFSHRNMTLKRYKEQKELQSRLDTLQKDMDNPNIDEETKREYFITLLKIYMNQSIDELNSLASEKRILEHMQKVNRKEPNFRHTAGTSSAPKAAVDKLKPIIITRDEIQKKVYGAGYPSLPVFTVQEFYDQRVKEGDWPDPAERNKMNAKCLQDMANESGAESMQEDIEAEEKEEKIEKDDQEYLEQARAMDEYKDTHRCGWGNRANRS